MRQIKWQWPSPTSSHYRVWHAILSKFVHLLGINWNMCRKLIRKFRQGEGCNRQAICAGGQSWSLANPEQNLPPLINKLTDRTIKKQLRNFNLIVKLDDLCRIDIFMPSLFSAAKNSIGMACNCVLSLTKCRVFSKDCNPRKIFQ